jgi:peptide deformylase
MILPVYGYGQAVLKKKGKHIPEDYPDLQELIDNMFETMYNADGVGLAAPQVGLSLRLFIVDTIQVLDEDKVEDGIKQAFINAKMIEEKGKMWTYEEGCLSIPNVRGDVDRQPEIKIRYQDRDFEWHEEYFDGVNARVIQHEYDHIEGVLFTEHLKPLRKRMVRRKLDKIRKGKARVDYPMRLANH